jgi:hypothetical protein
MIFLHSFAPALFLLGRGHEPVSVDRYEDGSLQIAFSDEARPAWQEYQTVKRHLNDLVATAAATDAKTQR